MKANGIKIARIAGAVVLVATIVIVWRATDVERFFSVSRLRAWLAGLGAIAPIAHMGLMTVAIVVSPFPTLPLDVAAGLAFGPILGTVYSLVGATIGATVAFLVARAIGRRPVARLVGGHLSVCSACSDKVLAKVVFFSRLIPVVSFDVVSYGAGLTAMSVRAFMTATFFGMIPLTFVYNYFGSVLDLRSWVGVAVAVVFVIAFVLAPRFIEKRNLFGLRRYLPHVGARTDLYDVLADAYETVFPLDPRRLEFCLGRLPPENGRLLDAGCGTGQLCREVTAYGHMAVGLDLENRMIENGRKTALEKRLFVELWEASVLDLEDIALGRRFHAVVCLGNTLPHLEGAAAVEDFVSQARRILLPDGALVIQILNYDRILRERPPELPPIETGRYEFERRYEYDHDRIVFSGELTDRTTGQTWSGRAIIRPVFRREVEEILSRRFEDVACLSGYDGRAADDEAFALLFVAAGHGDDLQ